MITDHPNNITASRQLKTKVKIKVLMHTLATESWIEGQRWASQHLLTTSELFIDTRVREGACVTSRPPSRPLLAFWKRWPSLCMKSPGPLLLGPVLRLTLVTAVGGASGDAATAQITNGEVLWPVIIVSITRVPGIRLRRLMRVTFCEGDARNRDGAGRGRHSSLMFLWAGHTHPGVSQVAGWTGRVCKNNMKKWSQVSRNYTSRPTSLSWLCTWSSAVKITKQFLFKRQEMFSNLLISTMVFSLTAGTARWGHRGWIATFFNTHLCLQTIRPLCMCQGIQIPAVFPPSYHFHYPNPHHQRQKSPLCLIYLYSVWNLQILINCKYTQLHERSTIYTVTFNLALVLLYNVYIYHNTVSVRLSSSHHCKEF